MIIEADLIGLISNLLGGTSCAVAIFLNNNIFQDLARRSYLVRGIYHQQKAEDYKM